MCAFTKFGVNLPCFINMLNAHSVLTSSKIGIGEFFPVTRRT